MKTFKEDFYNTPHTIEWAGSSFYELSNRGERYCLVCGKDMDQHPVRLTKRMYLGQAKYMPDFIFDMEFQGYFFRGAVTDLEDMAQGDSTTWIIFSIPAEDFQQKKWQGDMIDNRLPQGMLFHTEAEAEKWISQFSDVVFGRK